MFKQSKEWHNTAHTEFYIFVKSLESRPCLVVMMSVKSAVNTTLNSVFYLVSLREEMIMNETKHNKTLRVVIIDDESGAITVLTKLLERIGGIDIVVSEQNPNLGLRHIMVLKPDIVFLDIQMDKKNGIALLKEIKQLSVDSHIVITSGYDDYTFEAFKNGAFDYLIKPIVVEELEKVIFRIAREREELKNSNLSVEITNVADVKPTKIRTSNDQGYLLAHEILYLKASGSYTEIYCQGGQQEICTRGLWLLERELPEYFFKIHRSTVVNTRYVESLQIDSQLCVVANEDNTHELTISKANIASLEEYLHAR